MSSAIKTTGIESYRLADVPETRRQTTRPTSRMVTSAFEKRQDPTSMTRAQQTISIGLLVAAVNPPLKPHLHGVCHWCPCAKSRFPQQLYLACLYRLIPIFPKTVQNEILPVVRFFPASHRRISPHLCWDCTARGYELNLSAATPLDSSHIRRQHPSKARLRPSHIQ